MELLAEILQQIIFGMVIGCIYALIAICFVLIYKATDVINFAQGEMAVLSTFISYTLVVTCQWPYWLVFISSFVISFMIGVVTERLAFRSLIGASHLNALMVAVAVGMIFRNATGHIWTFDDVRMPPPFSDQVFSLPLGIVISPLFIGIICVSVAVVVVLFLFLNKTKAGLAIRATSQNPRAASLMGVPVTRVFSISWGLSSGIGAIAGILIAPLLVLNVGMFIIILKAIVAAVLGGFGSLPGAIVGGVLLGVMENLIGTYLPGWVKHMFVWTILLVVIIVLPQGLLGTRRHKRV
jgi:branched-chain amino acid transport system permease protein